jgi:hypothetical protein
MSGQLRFRRFVWFIAHTALFASFTLSIASNANSQTTCGVSDLPWVSVSFAEGPWREGLKEAALQDLKAGLASRNIETCQETEGPSKPPVAAIRISSNGIESVQVTVEIRDSVTEKRVSRDVDLSSMPLDGRALAIALAADELVWASWAEIALRGTKRRTAAPPQVVAAVEQNIQQSEQDSPRLGVEVAAEHFGAGVSQFGADALFVLAPTQRFRLRLALGIRQGLTVSAPDGKVRPTSAGMSFDGGPLLLKTSRIEIAWTAGAHVAWIRLQGDAARGALSSDLNGLALFARTGINAAVHAARPLWFEFGAGLGIPLRGLEATDAGRDVAGVAGLEQYGSFALLGEI